jgi:hypothetical protein
MVGNMGMGDLWTGALGPNIKPEPIAKTWRHDEDPNRRRATFGVPYPIWEISIEKSDDLHAKLPARFETTKRRSVEGVRFHLLARVYRPQRTNTSLSRYWCGRGGCGVV